jgi:hypothetical protein
MKNRTMVTSFGVSLFYVLIGTITVMVSFPDYSILGFDYNSPLWIPLVILTLPVNILLFGLIIVDNSFLSILILQSVVFFVTWFLFYKILSWIKRKKSRNTQSS